MYQLGSKEYWKGRVDQEDGESGHRWHQIVNFLDASGSPLHKAGAELNIAFIGFCCDEGVRRNKGRTGAQTGPDAIRAAMANLACHFNADSLALFDAGNVICPNQSMEQAQQLLGAKVNQLLKYGFLPVVLGGGHEVAYGHYLGLHEYTKDEQGSNLGIINLDAHFDLRSFRNESSSGTPFRQIWELRRQHDMPFHYLCLGIQEAANTQALFTTARQSKTNYLQAEQLQAFSNEELDGFISNWLADKSLVYLTLDMDVLASSFAPGVSAVNPLGLSPVLVKKIIGLISDSGKLLSFDLAEVNPKYDLDNQTAKLAANLIYSFIDSLSKRA